MVETYLGSIEELGKEERGEDRRGTIRIEDSKLAFIYDNGNTLEIKYEEIDSIVPQKLRYPKDFKEPLITLKDGRKFIFSITTARIRNRTMDFMDKKAVTNSYLEIKKRNKKITKLLKDLIK